MLALLALFACGNAAPVEPAPPAAPVAEAPPPAPPADAKPVADADTLETSIGTVTFHPVVHATMRIDVAGKTIWVDPWTKGDLSGPKADLLLITDIHFDHLDQAGIAAVKQDSTVIIAPAAVATDVPGAKVLANGDKTEAMGIGIEAVPMYNLVRGPEAGKLFHDKGRGNGYILTIGGKRIYIAGDTECTPEMKALTNIDVAFVPMNLPYTMPPDEAAACVVAFHPAVVYPFHYTDSDVAAFAKAVEPAGIVVRQRQWYPNGLPF
jgi:L-ascorbate metabolism protein UlaG (beta-lactamase superfamily)